MLEQRKDGFTLVELSIVLVIIGLLIGGILVGQSMTGTTRIQAQIKQFQQLDIAISTFKTKFNQIPGDCNICGHGTGGTWGDGLLTDFMGNEPPVGSIWTEPEIFFTDLYNMGILQTPYSYNTGKAASYLCFGPGGCQYPAAAIGRGGVMITGNASGDLYYVFITNVAPASQQNWWLMAWNSQGALDGTVGEFTPAEALALDTKFDDGNVMTGNIVTAQVGGAGIVAPYPLGPDWQQSNYCVYNNKYNLTVTTPACRSVIRSNYDGGGGI